MKLQKIILASITAYAFVRYSVSNQAGPYRRHKQDDASEKLAKNVIQYLEYDHREDEKKFWNRSIILGLATLISAFIAVTFSYLSFNDARKALNAVQRCFVFANIDQPVVQKSAKSPIRIWMYGPEWENSGNTESVNLKIQLICSADNFPLVDPYYSETRRIAEFGRVLGPKQKPTAGTASILPTVLSESMHKTFTPTFCLRLPTMMFLGKAT